MDEFIQNVKFAFPTYVLNRNYTKKSQITLFKKKTETNYLLRFKLLLRYTNYRLNE